MRARLLAALVLGGAIAWGWSAWGFGELMAEVVAVDSAARTLALRKAVGGRTWEVAVRLAEGLEPRGCESAGALREGDRVLVYYQEFKGRHLAAVVVQEVR